MAERERHACRRTAFALSPTPHRSPIIDTHMNPFIPTSSLMLAACVVCDTLVPCRLELDSSLVFAGRWRRLDRGILPLATRREEIPRTDRETDDRAEKRYAQEKGVRIKVRGCAPVDAGVFSSTRACTPPRCSLVRVCTHRTPHAPTYPHRRRYVCSILCWR
jgi:hypothetical protein